MKTELNNDILLNRKILKWEWYKDTNTVRLWIHLLLRVNYEPNTIKGIKIDRGELLTSVKSLSEETGLSVTSTRTSINKLKLTNNITIKTTNRYSILKVLKYNDYQLTNKQIDKPVDKLIDKQPELKLTTNKELKELKETKEEDKVIEDTVVETPTDYPYQLIITYLNQKLDTHYKATSSKTQGFIKARFNEKFTLEDFYKVIDNKYNEWFKTDMAKFLRPETLFGNKFESYLNQKEIITKQIGKNLVPKDINSGWLDEYINKIQNAEESNKLPELE